jgi:homocysteine S-methyltransferase
MLGLLPLRSYRHAEFLHNEIPGMVIPERILERLREAGDKAGSLGIEIATKFLNEAKSSVVGVYLMPPFKKYDMIPQILGGASLLNEEGRKL